MTGGEGQVRASGRVLRQALRQRQLRRALVAFLVFNIAEWATWVALLVWAYGRGGAGASGLIALVQLVPAALVAPFGSVLGDRMRRSRALALGYALQAGTMLATAAVLMLGASFGVVAVVAASAACAITLTRPVHHAIMPDIAQSPDALTAGNSASTTVEGVAGFIGPALSGVMLAAWGPGSVFALMAVLSAGSALLTVGLTVRARSVPAARGRLLASALAGFAEVSHDPGAALLVGMVGAQFVVVGLMDILTVVLALDVLGLGDAGPGWLTSALGAGAIVGGGMSVLLVGRRRLAPALAVGIVTTGLPIALLSLVGGPWVAAVLLLGVGTGRAFFDVAGRTLLQRTVRPDVLARIFGLQEALMMSGTALGSVLAPLAVVVFGPRGAFVVTGLLLPAMGLAAWVWIRRLDGRATQPGPAFRLLARLPVFAPLPQRSLEQLTWAATSVGLAAGQVVIREGDVGDRFYAVESGDLVVSRGGREIRELHAGDGFGEIALLLDSPRTATVTARTDVVLTALDRADFLTAVTGQPSARATADDVVRGYLAADDERG